MNKRYHWGLTIIELNEYDGDDDEDDKHHDNDNDYWKRGPTSVVQWRNESGEGRRKIDELLWTNSLERWKYFGAKGMKRNKEEEEEEGKVKEDDRKRG